MADVTYYFGAGASAQALPTYFNFKERLEYFVYIIESFLKTEDSYKGIYELRSELMELIGELEYHGTPDLVAKKYFHLGEDNKVYRLKNLINIFFIFEQTIDHFILTGDKEGKNPIGKRYDKRYDSLIARILRPQKGTFQLPSNFKILTWNYDFQFSPPLVFPFFWAVNSPGAAVARCYHPQLLHYHEAEIFTPYNDLKTQTYHPA